MYPTGKVASLRPTDSDATKAAYEQAAQLLDLQVRLRDIVAVHAFDALDTPDELSKAGELLFAQKAAEAQLEVTIEALNRHVATLRSVAPWDGTDEDWARLWADRGAAHLARVDGYAGKAVSPRPTGSRPTPVDDAHDRLVQTFVARTTDRFRAVRRVKAERILAK